VKVVAYQSPNRLRLINLSAAARHLRELLMIDRLPESWIPP
jgi:hypothetical protein